MRFMIQALWCVEGKSRLSTKAKVDDRLAHRGRVPPPRQAAEQTAKAVKPQADRVSDEVAGAVEAVKSGVR